MCGIFGLISSNSAFPVTAEEEAQILRSMRHRGPDATGRFVNTQQARPIDPQGPQVLLLHTRLSIIDLSTGQQPMSNADKSLWVTFNGEIYNYQFLKRELQDKGFEFKTQSDTEVLLHGYAAWGDSLSEKLRGQFAFAVWDQNRQRALLARDRAGEKPLYYCEQPFFVFASELKSLLCLRTLSPELDYRALQHYFALKCIPSPQTPFKTIRKLPPGYRGIWQKGQWHSEPYWQFPIAAQPQAISENDAIQLLQEKLREAVRLQLMSDVPLGAFLSGGIDSSAIVGLMSQVASGRVKTFSIGFEDSAFSEVSHARTVAQHFGTDHEELIVPWDIRTLLPKMIYHLDEPFADASAIPTYHVARLARQKVTVALSGDGSDELFGGYPRYQAKQWALRYQQLPQAVQKILPWMNEHLPDSNAYIQKNFIKKLKRFAAYVQTQPHSEVFWLPAFNGQEQQQLFQTHLWDKLQHGQAEQNLSQLAAQSAWHNPIQRMLYVDFRVFLPDDILTKVDRMSMAVSLESRAPFLDPVLIEWVAQLPLSLKIRGKHTKYVLRRAVEPLLPRHIVSRPKQGFVVPVANWLRGELRQYTQELLFASDSSLQHWVQPAPLQRYWQEHQEKRHDHSDKLWTLLCFELWQRLMVQGKSLESFL